MFGENIVPPLCPGIGKKCGSMHKPKHTHHLRWRQFQQCSRADRSCQEGWRRRNPLGDKNLPPARRKHSPNPSCASRERDRSCHTFANYCRSLRHRIYLHASGDASGGWNRKSNACFDGLGECLRPAGPYGKHPIASGPRTMPLGPIRRRDRFRVTGYGKGR